MIKYLSVLFITLVLFTSCNKQNELLTTASLEEYFPLKVGKYITYNLDSTVFINFGSKDTVRRYRVKDSIAAQITDNSGRPAYRIFRLIFNNRTDTWMPSNTFMAVQTGNSVEFVENNLRFQKLKLPIRNGYTWKGNNFIDTYSLNSNYKYLDDWSYTYDSVNTPLILGLFNLTNTLTVKQRDEFLGQDPKLANTQYAEKNYGIEKYARNIGLVYKEFIHWEYQGTQPGRPAYYTGYGVKLTMTDHN